MVLRVAIACRQDGVRLVLASVAEWLSVERSRAVRGLSPVLGWLVARQGTVVWSGTKG